MKRKLLYLTTIILTLVGCASEDYVGNHELHEANENGRPVSFNLVAAPQTRAVGGEYAADLLNNNFVVYAQKAFTSPASTQVVFNNYQANYVTNTANTTTSNSAGWEYVGYKNLPYGTTTTSGGTLNTNGVATNAVASGVDQSIKYWDYSASQYDFFAYSLGKGDDPEPPASSTYAMASAMTSTGYQLAGTADQLKASYISNKKSVVPNASSDHEVELQFRNFASKVKLALYETVPGYSVKSVEFYPSASGSASGVPTLYASTNVLPSGGTYNISFDNGKAKAQLYTETDAPVTATYTNYLAFGTALTYTAGKDNLEEDATQYIGRSSDAATPTEAVTVLPNPAGTDLHLKVNYTLVARDGYGETIKVTGATATVPAAYAQWQPNCSYTYLFKISDNTNGSTGQAILGLSPITLDAVVNTNADGRQETITTVTEPSITTYQYGSNVEGTNEYYASAHVVEGTHTAGPIYIVVADGTGLATLVTTAADPNDINAKLYKVDVTVEEGSTAFVTEMVVANAIANPLLEAKDANGNAMTVTQVTTGTDVLSLTNQIEADDSPDGKAVVFRTPEENEEPVIYKAAKFTPTAGTIYVFEYTDTTPDPDVKYYKVIKVASGS